MPTTETLIIPNDLLFAEAVENLQQGKQVTIPVKGCSMRPFIVGERDQVVLQAPSDIAVGDIVLAHIPDRGYVLHRVIRCSDEQVVLQGDGNLQATETCTSQEICGQAIYIIRKGHKVLCASLRERLEARLWRVLLPIRKYLLFLLAYWTN